MSKIFKEYGGVVVTVLAVVALISLVAILMAPGGVLDGAFGSITNSFVDKSQELVDNAGTVPLPEPGKEAEEYTWAEIKAIADAGKAEEYFALGDTKTMTLTDGTAVEMQIVAFNADTKTDGSTAAITWMSKSPVAIHAMNAATAVDPSGTNVNGWAASEMRTWLQGDFYTTLPDEVKDVIVSVNKTYYDYTTSSTLTVADNVWIPSMHEVFGAEYDAYGVEDSGADYTAFFKDDNSRIKEISDGVLGSWLLRSAHTIQPHLFRSVNASGTGSTTSASYAGGVVLGFCM